MKTSSSSVAKSAAPKKSANAHSAQKRHSDSSHSLDAASGVRPEVTSPAATAVVEPSVRPALPARRRVRFGYFKPDAREVFLVGSFNGWDPRITPLRRDSLGDWSVELELPTGEHRYRFVVDGEWRDDPAAQQTAQNPYGGFDAIMVVM